MYPLCDVVIHHCLSPRGPRHLQFPGRWSRVLGFLLLPPCKKRKKSVQSRAKFPGSPDFCMIKMSRSSPGGAGVRRAHW